MEGEDPALPGALAPQAEGFVHPVPWPAQDAGPLPVANFSLSQQLSGFVPVVVR